MTETLRTSPDVGYYLRDVLDRYRHGSSGGSRAIRGHMRNVRIALKAALEADPPLGRSEPERRPVCDHLARAVDNGVAGSPGPMARTVRTFSRFAPALRWGFGYERMPPRLADAYAYAEILGPRGIAVCETLIVGVVLLAPRTVYPLHSHVDIAESYLCLSGALSQNDAGVALPGSMLYNPPGHEHRITTDAYEPCLLSYVWIGPHEAIVDQKMSFSRRR
jgi:dimethylpropiothetin dethiomethylase